MKIMQINNTYKCGSTGKMVFDIHSYLQKQGQDSVVCYGRGQNFAENKVYKTCGEIEARINRVFSRITGVKYGGCVLSTLKLIRKIKKEKPDIVHLQCLNGYFVNIYKLVSYLKKNQIKTVLTLHAEFMYTANCGHAMECNKWKDGCGNCPRLKEEIKSFWFDNTSLSWKKMKNAFYGFKQLQVVSVSKWLENRVNNSPIFANTQKTVILNGVNTDTFHLMKETSKIREKLNLSNKKIVFHATANFSQNEGHSKGGFYVVEMAKRFLSIDSDVVFLVAGNCDKVSDLPSNMIFLGNIDDQTELAKYYSMADVVLLTSKKETFSMVVAESLCCGTPVVGFKAGAPELIAIEEYSRFVPQGDCDELFKELQSFIYDKCFDKEKISMVSKEKYSKELMGEKYLNLYLGLMEKDRFWI